MSTPVLASNSDQWRRNDNKTEVIRRTAGYHPSVWGDYFLKYNIPEGAEDDVKMDQQLQKLKEEVLSKRFVPAADNPSQILNLVDTIQRLGVSYHFGSVINDALQRIYETCHNQDDKVNDDDDDLYTVALKFRLLRQQGFPVSADMFNKFKDGNGRFRESLTGDVRGLLSLYEASHLRVRGEDLLDEALDFTTTHLESALSIYLRNPLGEQVIHALKQPIRTGLNRLEARSFISLYEEDDCHDEVLLILAKLDFNLLQKMHQRELSQITMWWKDLDFSNKLPFARDRIVECYFWILGVYFEPQYSLARMILSKVISMTSIIDDIYDVYGTLEELVLFTDAIERWDISAMDQLPGYMRLCYQALLDVYNMIEGEMAKEGKSYCVQYAKAAMKELVRAYFDEAKWLHRGYVPTMEEYMDVALVTGAYRMLATTSFVGMGKLATKEAFEWVSNDPLIVRASSVICRLMDDMAGHKFEQKRGHIASAVECYMKEHGTSEEETLIEFQKQVTNAWKDINEECLQSTEIVPMPLLERVLNLARVINLLYKDKDGYTHSGTKLKKFVTSVLIDSLSLSVC